MKKPIVSYVFLLFLVIFACLSCAKNETTTPGRDKFLGSWSVVENHNKGTFPVTILADPNESSRVLIDNFAGEGSGNRATAVISGNSITLDANQSVGGATNLSGSGNMSSASKIDWTYSFIQGGSLTNATAVFTKQ